MVATLEELGRQDCLNLLATASVGRVGFIVDGKPEVLPVNYGLDGDTVVFRTAEGSALNHASLSVIAFEVDHIEETTRSGWSVVVQGVAQSMGDALDATSERLRRLEVITWAPGTRQRWFRVTPDRITGRRLRVSPDAP
jgi:nitroimidazol reductase NimA-like FMN-containing flavoprotein (pyridoxamine 5'-phosphate oxidase superfamily)